MVGALVVLGLVVVAAAACKSRVGVGVEVSTLEGIYAGAAHLTGVIIRGAVLVGVFLLIGELV